MRIRYEKLFYFSLIMYYIIPNFFIGNYGKNIYQINRGIYNIVMFVPILLIILLNHKCYLKEIFLVIFVLIKFFIFKDIEVVSLLIFIVIDRFNFDTLLNKNRIEILLKIIIIVTLLYSYLFYGLTGRLISTSILEVNMSGFSIFILYLLAINKTLKGIFFLLGFLIFSRNFLLAIILTKVSEKFKILGILFSKLNFFRLCIIIFLSMILIDQAFQYSVNKYGLVQYGQGIKRYSSILDKSNLDRFQANTNVLKYYRKYPEKILTGVKIKDFTDELRENKEEYNVTKIVGPHNFVYKYLLKYGIFSIYLFWYISNILGKFYKKDIQVLIGYLVYSIILGIGFYDVYLLILKYLLVRIREKNEV